MEKSAIVASGVYVDINSFRYKKKYKKELLQKSRFNFLLKSYIWLS